MANTEKQTTRVQVDWAPEKVRQIEELMEECGISTKKEFLNNALTLLSWAIKQRKNGRVIAAIDEEDHSYTSMTIPALENLRSVLHR